MLSVMFNLLLCWCRFAECRHAECCGAKKSHIFQSPLLAAATSIHCFLACVNTA
jgi:hypothetical protein